MLSILCYLFHLLKFMLGDAFSKLKNKQIYYLCVECQHLYVIWNTKKQAEDSFVMKEWWAEADTQREWKQTHESH